MQSVAIIGAGPAGLIAAEQLARAGHAVTIYDQMPSPGRKFLLAGRGGLNLTHSEPAARFIERYGPASAWMAEALATFPQAALREWCEGLGQDVFVGSSGRVFPESFKAAPLLRAWLRRLDGLGVRFAGRHCWRGWDEGGALVFTAAGPTITVAPDATLLALGGASWPRMGSDGAWVSVLRAAGLCVNDLRASNCGVCIAWSAIFADRFEGQPLKRIALSAGGRTIRGEAVITRGGLEGGAIYALSPALRPDLDRDGAAMLHIDLRPDLALAALSARVDRARQGRSLSNFLGQAAQLSPAAIGLVQEALHAGAASDRLSALIKAVPLRASGLQLIARAISSAGGLARDELDAQLMLHRLPGVFAAGEMLDWEAPTGGYLLQACFSTGALAACGIAAWLAVQARRSGSSDP